MPAEKAEKTVPADEVVVCVCVRVCVGGCLGNNSSKLIHFQQAGESGRWGDDRHPEAFQLNCLLVSESLLHCMHPFMCHADLQRKVDILIGALTI